MSQPIYVMFQLRMTEAWYQLNEKEQSEILDKLTAIDKKFGVETLIVCESGWSNDEWQFFGLSKHQSVETIQEWYKGFEEVQWYRYIYSKTLLGTPWSRS